MILSVIKKFVCFLFHARFLHIDESFFFSPPTSLFVIQNTDIFYVLNFKALKGGKMPLHCERDLLRAPHSLLHLIIHSHHSSTSGENDWQHLQTKAKNNPWYRWHPPWQDSLYRKESMSDTRGVFFFSLDSFFCVCEDFSAFNDPCFALHQKQAVADYTIRKITLFPFCQLYPWLMMPCSGISSVGKNLHFSQKGVPLYSRLVL